MKYISVKSDPSCTDIITSFIEENLSCFRAVISHICIISDEIVSNIVSYSNAVEITVGIDVYRTENRDTIRIIFIDNGNRFNPLESEDPDVNLPVSERGEGGLGIFLVKKLSDSVIYSYENEKNVLTVTKFINSERNFQNSL